MVIRERERERETASCVNLRLLMPCFDSQIKSSHAFQITIYNNPLPSPPFTSLNTSFSSHRSMEVMMEDSSKVKRKRTNRKRQRLQLSSAGATGPSSSTSAEFSEITTAEEEDMAKCLILLAEGSRKPEPKVIEEAATAMKFTSRRFAEAETTTSGKAGFFVYECKSCNKCFPSFQALGGHRASHKKPKISLPSASADETKTAVMNEDSIQLRMDSFSSQAPVKTRIHECSICSSKFNSGQALGGHMRRHRPLSLHEPAKKEGTSNRLLLDLNLPPAPCDDDGDLAKSSSSVSATKTPSFSFASKPPILVLASSFVDCHYGSDSNSNISQ